MANKDRELLDRITHENNIHELREKFALINSFSDHLEHPYDTEVVNCLNGLKEKLRGTDDDYEIFNHLDEIKKVWTSIIRKSIKCLRFFDKREPFMQNKSKKPIAYGIDDLEVYFEKYTDFESMLYGGNKYYRDHLVHVFRTWLLGIDCLLRNNGEYLEKIKIGEEIDANILEKISIWSIIALTHDLGYPLEKAHEIINKTKDMMHSFVANPNISMDLSFSGVQNNMNDFVLRFISSRMVKRIETDEETEEERNEKLKIYAARLQPKYYFKFQKSLEASMHGILSAIIIYKMLLYFLESDYNVNEDYFFNSIERRQFYIRREILRAISSHTCHDIYHLDILTFSFLLILSDDCQEWGRKSITELYINTTNTYSLVNINLDFSTTEPERYVCTISEEFKLNSKRYLMEVLDRLKKQSDIYKAIFRDGQDTKNRNFTFIKKCDFCIDSSPIRIQVTFTIGLERGANYLIQFPPTGNVDLDREYNLLLNSFKEQYKSEYDITFE